MPPKKTSEKAIAAETKKQNTLKAKNILDELRNEEAKSRSDGGSKPSIKKPENDKPVRSNKVQVRSKVVAKPKRSNLENVSTASSEATMQPIANSTTTGGSCGFISPSEHVVISERNETPPNVSTSGQTKSVHVSEPRSNESGIRKSTGNVTNKESVDRSKAVSSHGSAYQYEIDCKNVADSIDVKDLKIHLEKHLKIKGKKENFGSTVSIVCEGQKVVIKSETFFPKKSLRFLSKKFLKKNWNIRVLSKNVHSYEYKYVGMP